MRKCRSVVARLLTLLCRRRRGWLVHGCPPQGKHGSRGGAGDGGGGGGGKSRLRQLQEELAAAKEARKLVEQDAQLLANRIALLKQEEEKAWKKIRQTKTRAQEIVALRAENEQRVLERQAAAEELTAQQREVVDRHHLEKQLQRKARERLAAEKEKEKRRAAAEVKASKLKHKKEVERQRRAEVAKARRTKAGIRQEREAARRRREKAEVRGVLSVSRVCELRVCVLPSVRVLGRAGVACCSAAVGACVACSRTP